MKNQAHICHDYYLDRLVANMNKNGYVKENVEWIMKDGIYLRPDSQAQFKLADLVVKYYNFEGTDFYIADELKSSHKQKHKAKKQLASTEEFLRDCHNATDYLLKVTYYNGGKYNWEIIKFVGDAAKYHSMIQKYTRRDK